MKLKRYIPILALFILVSGNVFGQKIGYTNVEVLLSYMPEVEGVQKQLDNFGKALQKPITVKEEYYQTIMTEYYEKSQIGFQAGEEEKYQKQLGDLQVEIQTAYQEAEYKLMAKQSELLQPVMERIQKAIDEVASEDGFKYILNQTSGNNILYGVPTLDVTEKLARKLGINLE